MIKYKGLYIRTNLYKYKGGLIMEKEIYTLEKKYDKKLNRWDINVRFGDYTHASVGLTEQELKNKYRFFDGVLRSMATMIKNDYVKIKETGYDSKVKVNFDIAAIAEECNK